jgi:hypothetical protein
MIDSGSTISLIGADTLKSDEGISPVPIRVSSITGDKLPVVGMLINPDRCEATQKIKDDDSSQTAE